ncbi:MAG: phenylalanine--tRNA ligase subunit beta [Bacteroidales bacterium]|nr:phenylalanine--tRNA ligase subunit beta [Bacteroidales bacterium]
MNISYNWLREYVDGLPEPKALAAALTSTGLECDTVEEVESIRGGLRGIVIGRVLTCVEHPDSDHLHITTVDLGLAEGPVQIVCGAANVAAGQNVVVATVGTTLYDGDNEFKIKKSKIRGVESFGMICAEDEIGVGSSHDGIIVIPDDKAPAPGTPAAEYFGLESDYVLEVDLTPNRIDGASHFGVARDWAAKASLEGIKPNLRRPEGLNPTELPAGKAVKVTVVDPSDCPRYCGLTIRNVKVAESPDWLKNRLTAIGQRPINNIVDITNYILHSFCQPLHCFDLSKVKGEEVIVKTLPAGTKFTTLDGVERTLNERDLMICNSEEPMCMAGVFGGLDSGVTESATDIFLESACFNPTTIRKAARRHALNTDSSFRFERGVDPNGCLYALMVAAKMITELAGGEICGPVVDLYPNPVQRPVVELSFAQLNALIGAEIPADAVKAILASLDIEIESETNGMMTLRIPTYRVDVTRPCDVIEEVLRIYGYNNVGFTDHVNSSLSYKSRTDIANDLTRKALDRLAAQGFHEILNNSLTSTSYYPSADVKATYPLERCVKLMNPLSSDLGVMRQTLLFGGLEVIAHNANRRNPDLMLVEQGNIYSFNPDAQSTTEQPLAPYSEASRLALWISGNVKGASWLSPAEPASIYHLRAYVEGLLSTLGLDARQTTVTPSATMPDIFSAELSISSRSGKALGHLGIISHDLQKKFDIERPVLFAELDRDAIIRLVEKHNVTFTPIARTQAVRRDLALLIDTSVTFAQIQEIVSRSERKLLRGVELFDVYEGKNLPAGKKSYAIAITLQDPEKTLQDKQIDAVMQKIIKNLQAGGAELR